MSDLLMVRYLIHMPWIDTCRARRMGELIGIIWCLSVIDLVLTLWAHFFTPFQEGNPIAAAMLQHDLLLALVIFKLWCTLLGTHLLWRVNDRVQAEAGAWLVAGVYVMLMFRWAEYVQFTT